MRIIKRLSKRRASSPPEVEVQNLIELHLFNALVRRRQHHARLLGHEAPGLGRRRGVFCVRPRHLRQGFRLFDGEREFGLALVLEAPVGGGLRCRCSLLLLRLFFEDQSELLPIWLTNATTRRRWDGVREVWQLARR